MFPLFITDSMILFLTQYFTVVKIDLFFIAGCVKLTTSSYTASLKSAWSGLVPMTSIFTTCLTHWQLRAGTSMLYSFRLGLYSVCLQSLDLESHTVKRL